jgi:hypothetical protein
MFFYYSVQYFGQTDVRFSPRKWVIAKQGSQPTREKCDAVKKTNKNNALIMPAGIRLKQIHGKEKRSNLCWHMTLSLSLSLLFPS